MVRGISGPRSGMMPEHPVAVVLRLALNHDACDWASMDWRLVFAVSRAERCLGLAWLRSGHIIRGYAPSDIVSRWRTHAIELYRAGREQLSLLAECVEGLRANAVSPVVLKGIPLSSRLYGDPFVRATADFDLYIPAAERDQAGAGLLAMGWRRGAGRAPGEELWTIGEGDGARHLEVHSSAVSDHLGHLPVSPPEVLEMTIESRLVPARSDLLEPACLAAHLAQHHFPPLLWFIDLATLWQSLSPGERASASRLAAAARLEGYLQWGVRRVGRLERATNGDTEALQGLGFGGVDRTDLHPLWRHVTLASTFGDAGRVVRSFVLPRQAGRHSGGAAEIARRSRRHWRSLFVARSGYEPVS